MKKRWNAAGFSLWKFGIDSKRTRKTLIGTTPFPKPNLKAQYFQAPKANANRSFLIANVRKLRFYENKELSTDWRYGVPNTFLAHNQNSELKNQDFLSLHNGFGKMTFFVA